MRDEIIKFETGILALKKGFRFTHIIEDRYESICHIYTDGGYLCKYVAYEPDFYDEEYPDIPAPTQSMLQRWLREEHDIQIKIERLNTIEDGWQYVGEYGKLVASKGTGYFSNIYEEVLEETLIKALKFIEDV